ncbi:unnamed protein product [Oreochromis niloticus]|nr:unnamed protein product [Mustela putorius furo]
MALCTGAAAIGNSEQELCMPIKGTEKYKKIISNSDEKSHGCPAVYQLRPEETKIGTLTRVTVGKKNLDKKNKTILLVGETGPGKSTLINALFNYTMGVKWEDKVWFQIVKEKEKSQTSDVIVYEIFDFDAKTARTLPQSLTIIDTPEYGNTRGTEHDEIISQRLLDLFGSEDGIHEVHAVGLVMKASENLMSDRLRYIFDSVMSLFGKDLEKNIIALIIDSDGRVPKNALKALEAANIKCARNEKDQPVYFLFNNCQHEERTVDEQYLKYGYETSERGMKEFTAFLEETTPLKPVATPEVLKERIRLTACIQNLQERIIFTEVKEREMKQIQEALKKHDNMKNEEKNNKEFTSFVAEVFKHQELIREEMCEPGFKAALICKVCEENCHYPGCTVLLNHCEVFKDGFCTSCTGMCPASNHVKEKWRYVTRKKKDQKNEQQVKLKDVHLLEQEMKQLTAEKSQLLDKSYQHVVRLEQIALKADKPSTIVHLDFLIEKMKEKGDTEKAQKLEEMRIRADEGPRAAVCVISSPHEDIILNSFLIRPGSPTVYQLRPKKEMFGTLTRMTIGEKNTNIINKTMLLVGETGTGKSTLINALISYAIGVKWEDEVWFQIIEEEKKENQTVSQTPDVIVYEIFGFENKIPPYSLTIIDTPGFGDTEREGKDDIISQRLLDLFRSDYGVREVHAVGLVMKASENRLSDRLMYTFDSVMSLFGKNMEKNIVALITHSDGSRPENAFKALEAANIKCARNEKNEPVYFLFNNRQYKDRKEENTISKHSWEFTQKNMDHLTEFLGKSSPQKLIKTVEVLNERIRLTACIQNLKERIELIELKQTKISKIREALRLHEEKKMEAAKKIKEANEMQETLKRKGAQKSREALEIQETLKKLEEEMKENEKFTVEVDEPYKVYEEIKVGIWDYLRGHGKAVSCKVCEENCHYPGCTMAWSPSWCEVMKNDLCTACTNKCPPSYHVKENKKYVTKTKKVQKTNEEMKKKYQLNKSECELKRSQLQNVKKEANKLKAADPSLNQQEMQQNYEKYKRESEETSSLLENLKEEMKQLTAEKTQWLEEAYQHVVKLEEIALKADSVSTIDHLDFLIEKLTENTYKARVQKLKEMRSRVDEKTKSAYWYKLAQIPSAIKYIVKPFYSHK